MKFTIENGDVSVKSLKVNSMATSCIVFIGDTRSLGATSWFESPPEENIVGVTPALRTTPEQGDAESEQ